MSGPSYLKLQHHRKQPERWSRFDKLVAVVVWVLLQPARQREASAREHFLEAASGPTSEGSLHICSAHIGKIAIAVALDLEPNGSGGRRVVGVASSHPDHPSASR